jgi:tubulin-specific chaperone D
MLLPGASSTLRTNQSVRFFPHEVADLPIVLDYMLAPNTPAQVPTNWSLRYVFLLWLSLICMIPFDLAQFDDGDHIGQTAASIEALAKGFLGNAGLEREGAAILLSRLYMRYTDLRLFIVSLTVIP